uniref:AMP_N domain-containing protein n=1 Tax=Steinernema glaseri TaxID=37863 RepID=A0A1I7YB17_9BILA
MVHDSMCKNDDCGSMIMSFNRGRHTLHVEADLFVENRRRLADKFNNGCILLQGGVEKNRYNTDADDLPFRQESYFFWAFGVHESGVSGLINVITGKSVLFPPRLPEDYAIWEGQIRSADWYKEKYLVDEVIFNDQYAIYDYLKRENVEIVHVLVCVTCAFVNIFPLGGRKHG